MLSSALLTPALKCDLRDDAGVKEKLQRRHMHPVSYEEGLATARAIRATRYLGEASSWWLLKASTDLQNARHCIIEASRKLSTRLRAWP